MSAGTGTEVTARDLDSGASQSRTITDDYCVTTDGDCYVAHVQSFANGTHIITIKNVGGERE